MRTEVTSGTTSVNRRRHPRVPVGLPVEVHVDEPAQTLTVELIDIAAGGVRLRPLTASGIAAVDRRATFGFIVPGGGKCVAGGRIGRVQNTGEFVVVLDRANPAFREFVRSLCV